MTSNLDIIFNSQLILDLEVPIIMTPICADHSAFHSYTLTQIDRVAYCEGNCVGDPGISKVWTTYMNTNSWVLSECGGLGLDFI